MTCHYMGMHVSRILPMSTTRISAFGCLLVAALALLIMTVNSGQARAQSASGFANYLPQLKQQTLNAGVSRSTVERVFPTLSYLSNVVSLDRSQPGGSPGSAIPPYAPYRDRHVTSERIRNGRDKMNALRPMLSRIEAETGVPKQIMIAIYGKETNYGSYMGNTDVPSALATLAYEGRRRDFFAAEFIAAMQMIDDGVPRSKLEGSWAGAMGRPQFMPSTYLRLAVDGTGDGLADIWASETDAMASVANYLSEAGWRRGVPWGVAVNVPSGLDRTAVASPLNPVRCERVFERHSEWKTLAEWRSLGLTAQGGWPSDGNILATLLEPDGAGRTAYLLTGNYRAILDYNCSNFYALSVGLLADAYGS